MIKQNQNSDYYEGCRDAIYQYAIHKDEGMIVGCGIKSYRQAIEEINDLEKEAKDFEKLKVECNVNTFTVTDKGK